MSVEQILKQLPEAYIPGAAGGRSCVLQFNMSQPAYVAIADDKCALTHGISENPDVDLTMSDENFVELMQGRLNGVMAVMSGKLAVSGDLSLARQMLEFFDASKLA
ncbi:SCP2 sterol-binding domain-containing protein [Paraburkholderia fungorum]|uniref:Sterol-binding protein n=1 Tax=Paraburkholderia fungorum TaxID=134537 RepID=A0A420FKF3_9BURK|nr:SCP2 sterol-binding domain-containing protein [Paraburkholderia fungorum]RKF33357.1 sterol-binding protein [Paraburkholderia fungorum]